VDRGTIAIGDTDITANARRSHVSFRTVNVGFVFQFHHLAAEFTALENARCRCALRGCRSPTRRPRAEDLLRRVGLGDRLTHRPGMLSGGEPANASPSEAPSSCDRRCCCGRTDGDLRRGDRGALHELLRGMHRDFGLTSIIRDAQPAARAACDRILVSSRASHPGVAKVR